MRYKKIIAAICLPAAAACTIKPPPVIVTSEKTALENQLLGSNALLTDDPLSVTAVWSREFEPGVYSPYADQAGADVDRDDTRTLILAQIRRQTLQDHISQLKRNGFLGEKADGILTIIPDSAARNEEITRIVAAENTDRAVIWEFYAAVSGEEVSEALDSIRRTFAGIMIKSSPTGTWVEDDNGNWARK